MSKKKTYQKKPALSAAVPAAEQSGAGWKLWAVPGLMALMFLATCLVGGSGVKPTVMILILAAVASCVIRLPYVRDRLSLPMAAVVLWVLMNGISMFYAVSGRFALRAFLYIAAGFCIFLLILAWSRRGEGSGRAAASVLTGSVALASLVSIDMLSTHWLSGSWFALLGLLTGGSSGINTQPVEVGVRMLSLYQNPNCFAGVAGLGVLLALELAVTARETGERWFHQVCLFLNALAFILAFSMGASGMIAVAFLALLILERKERRGFLLLLMVETLVLSLLCAFPVFITAFDAWDGFQPVPLLCAAAGAAALCAVDHLVGRRIAGVLEGKEKLLGAAVAVILALLAGFAALAVNVTGAADLAAGEGLRRSGYPEAGAYTLRVEATGPVTVIIESQNQQDTMMHTSTVLYDGDAQGAAFTVPEDSMVVYFNFNAPEGAELGSAVYEGPAGTESLKLGYKLLPGFIANRLQGLFANQNAIQRAVFFADGMKLVRRSPVFGLGIGAFENAAKSVQSFFYETKYTHNHYIETIVTTGVVGLVLFLGMLALCAAALWKNLRRKEEADPLAPALAAALVFMALHAGVEVVFSFCYYLPVAIGVFGLICLCAGKELPLLPEKEEVRSWVSLGMCVPLVVFAVLLQLNMSMDSMLNNRDYTDPFAALEQATDLDFFDRNSYMLSYVYAAKDLDPRQWSIVRAQADKYADRLAKVDSNSIPIALAEYYFTTGRPERAMEMLEKHVDYSAADSKAWQDAFGYLQNHYEDAELFREGAARLYEKMQEWDRNNIGSITLTEGNQAFLNGVLGLS